MSLGKAMVDAAHGAVLGRAIGDANDRAEDAIEKALGWQRYAGQLESEIERLNRRIKDLEGVNSTAQARLDETTKSLANEKASSNQFFTLAKNQGREANATTERAKQYKSRLSQVEKALRHSSANVEALKIILEPYKALVQRMNLENELPDDLAARADEIRRKYMEGESLTNDPDVQAILDANPLPPKPPLSAID